MNQTSAPEGLHRAVIPPLVRRHVEDAAFYWMQLDGGIGSPSLTFGAVERFERMRDAHLEGTLVAGDAGAAVASETQARWRKPGEAFVLTWLAVRLGRQDLQEDVLQRLCANPEAMVRGMVSALALNGRDAVPWTLRLSLPAAPAVAQVVALRVAALQAPDSPDLLAAPLLDYLRSADPHVQAAACRAAARRGLTGADLAVLESLLDDDTPASVRAAAAIALQASDWAGDGTAPLWQCVVEQARWSALATGWYRKQALRRLDRWVRHLAVMVPPGHVHLPHLFDVLPPRLALAFALHHGDPAHLPRVLAAMDDASHARYAGWVWQTLTGLRLDQPGLHRPESPDAPSAPTRVADEWRDEGLPLPDAAACAANMPRLPEGTRVLLGQTATRPQAVELLERDDIAQAVRRVAVSALGASGPNLRAPVAEQRRALQLLRHHAAL